MTAWRNATPSGPIHRTESAIFDKLLDVAARFEDFVIYAYGSYEKAYLKRLGEEIREGDISWRRC